MQTHGYKCTKEYEEKYIPERNYEMLMTIYEEVIRLGRKEDKRLRRYEDKKVRR